MGFLPVLARIEWRRRRRQLVALGVAASIGSGVAVAALAGAERSQTSLERFERVSASPELYITAPPGRGRPATSAAVREAGTLPGVAGAAQLRVYAALPDEAAGSEDRYFPLAASLDGRITVDVGVPRVLSGRLPDPTEALEVAVSERTAESLGVGVGDLIPIVSLTRQDLEAAEDEMPEPGGPSFSLEVTGITRDPGDVVARADDISITFLTPAFVDRFDGQIGAFTDLAAVDLEGVSAAGLDDAVAELDPDAAIEFGGTLVGDDSAATTLAVIASSLRILAAVVAVGTLALVGQAMVRMGRRVRDEDGTLRALGASRADRTVRAAAPGAAVVALAAIGTPIVAAGLSPLFPIGLGRRAEPDPGFDVDASILLAGAGVSVLLLSGVVTFAVVVSARALRTPRRTGPRPGVAAVWPLARLATGARGAADLRSARVGLAAAVAGVAAATVFAASLGALLDGPSRYGITWDAGLAPSAVMDTGGQQHVEGGVVAEIAADPAVAEADAAVFQIFVTVNGSATMGYAIGDGRGDIGPVVASGRAPVADDEVALGPATLERTGVSVGDEVEVEVDGRARSFEVVGRAVLPVSGDGGTNAEGAAFVHGAAARLGIDGCDDADSCYQQVLVRWNRDVDVDATAARLGDGTPEWTDVAPPGAVQRMNEVRSVPVAVAALVGLVGVLAVAHGSITFVGGRRRDFALLRALGCTRSQLRRVVVLHLAVTAIGGALVGGVLGTALGRSLWTVAADRLAVRPSPQVSLVGIAGVALVGTATVVIAGLGPVVRAGRVRPTIELRAE